MNPVCQSEAVSKQSFIFEKKLYRMFRKRYTIIAKNEAETVIKKRIFARSGDAAKTIFYKQNPNYTIKVFKRRKYEKLYIAIKWVIVVSLFLFLFGLFLYIVAKRTALNYH